VLVANCSAMPQGFFTWQVTDNSELGLFRVKLTRNARSALLPERVPKDGHKEA
jgi:hypothetical protein